MINVFLYTPCMKVYDKNVSLMEFYDKQFVLYFLSPKFELKTLVKTLVMFCHCHTFSPHKWPAQFQFLHEIHFFFKSFLVLFLYFLLYVTATKVQLNSGLAFGY